MIVHTKSNSKSFLKVLDQLFYEPINFVSRLASKTASTSLTMICRAVALQLQPTSSIKNANLTTLEFIYMFQDINLHVPISEHQKIWQHPQFDANRKLVILASGWRNTVNESNSVGLISQALIELGNVNVVVVDVANLVDTFYMWSALNTNTIGDLIGEALKRLIELVPAQSKEIHLIGHSIGAHVMGSAGRKFLQLTGKLLPRITGLDPAKPCFRLDNNIHSLARGDALLVDIIHTNVDTLGVGDPVGDLDFYPGGYKAIQPSCQTAGCSHARAIKYFADSVYSRKECVYLGRKCNSVEDLSKVSCKSTVTSTMGYVINETVRGILNVQLSGARKCET